MKQEVKSKRNKPSKYAKGLVSFRPTEECMMVINKLTELDPKKSQSVAVRALVQMAVDQIMTNGKLYKKLFDEQDEVIMEDNDNLDEEYNTDYNSIYDNY
jgi:hypothetical protein